MKLKSTFVEIFVIMTLVSVLVYIHPQRGFHCSLSRLLRDHESPSPFPTPCLTSPSSLVHLIASPFVQNYSYQSWSKDHNPHRKIQLNTRSKPKTKPAKPNQSIQSNQSGQLVNKVHPFVHFPPLTLLDLLSLIFWWWNSHFILPLQELNTRFEFMKEANLYIAPSQSPTEKGKQAKYEPVVFLYNSDSTQASKCTLNINQRQLV